MDETCMNSGIIGNSTLVVNLAFYIFFMYRFPFPANPFVWHKAQLSDIQATKLLELSDINE